MNKRLDKQATATFLRSLAERIETEDSGAPGRRLEEVQVDVHYDWASEDPTEFYREDLSNRYVRVETATLRLRWEHQP